MLQCALQYFALTTVEHLCAAEIDPGSSVPPRDPPHAGSGQDNRGRVLTVNVQIGQPRQPER
jgi:hypothetical protein